MAQSPNPRRHGRHENLWVYKVNKNSPHIAHYPRQNRCKRIIAPRNRTAIVPWIETHGYWKTIATVIIRKKVEYFFRRKYFSLNTEIEEKNINFSSENYVFILQGKKTFRTFAYLIALRWKILRLAHPLSRWAYLFYGETACNSLYRDIQKIAN